MPSKAVVLSAAVKRQKKEQSDWKSGSSDTSKLPLTFSGVLVLLSGRPLLSSIDGSLCVGGNSVYQGQFGAGCHVAIVDLGHRSLCLNLDLCREGSGFKKRAIILITSPFSLA